MVAPVSLQSLCWPETGSLLIWSSGYTTTLHCRELSFSITISYTDSHLHPMSEKQLHHLSWFILPQNKAVVVSRSLNFCYLKQTRFALFLESYQIKHSYLKRLMLNVLKCMTSGLSITWGLSVDWQIFVKRWRWCKGWWRWPSRNTWLDWKKYIYCFMFKFYFFF